jgi:hypothetical protein
MNSSWNKTVGTDPVKLPPCCFLPADYNFASELSWTVGGSASKVITKTMSILRDLFGPSRDEIWQQFAAVVSGNFTENSFWNGSKVVATQSQWTVTLDTYTHNYPSRRPLDVEAIRIRCRALGNTANGAKILLDPWYFR